MKVVVTGGAGFIGSNIAAHCAKKGDTVVAIDNLSRAGTERNIKWFKKDFPQISFIQGDIRDSGALEIAFSGADLIYHMAAQVAVTTSVEDPRTDFEVNALGTFNVLEATRTRAPGAIVIYASTNKVYGGMEQASVQEIHGRWEYADEQLRGSGIPESFQLDFHSPYGCSKGAGDQYVRDYARIYGLKTIVFRQSCIYGPRQFGNEDQGWVMYFTKAALEGNPITIYGDGKQIRDILHVDDLIAAYEAGIERIDHTSGQIFNIGGSPRNTISLLELIAWLERTLQKKVSYSFADWRPGDQKVYVSDVSALKSIVGWEPKIEREQGLQSLLTWAQEIVG